MVGLDQEHAVGGGLPVNLSYKLIDWIKHSSLENGPNKIKQPVSYSREVWLYLMSVSAHISVLCMMCKGHVSVGGFSQ